MLIQLLSDEEVQHCLDNWGESEDGSKTHHRYQEYKIKENKESINMPQEVRQLITSKLYNNSYINLVVCPNKISVNFYNEYEEGGFYHKHIDSFRAAPRSNNIYFDYGFSLGLSDDYEGGEFVLETEIAEVMYPVKKGQLLIFPIIYAHGVKPITKGSRKAIIGWMSSKVSYEQSYILKNLYEINSRFIKGNDESMALKSTLVQNYLSKHWGA
jgi:PKHD-type hydroxylase